MGRSCPPEGSVFSCCRDPGSPQTGHRLKLQQEVPCATQQSKSSRTPDGRCGGGVLRAPACFCPSSPWSQCPPGQASILAVPPLGGRSCFQGHSGKVRLGVLPAAADGAVRPGWLSPWTVSSLTSTLKCPIQVTLGANSGSRGRAPRCTYY